LDCAATLVPFFTECSDVLNAYFDSDDGVEDDAAKSIADMNHLCLNIDQGLVTTAIEQMKAGGCEVRTDGIEADKDGKSGRRLQHFGYQGQSACSLDSFDGRCADVDTACCSDGSGTSDKNCHAGIPTVCGFECAAEWTLFVTECDRIIAVMMPESADDFDRVTQTCNTLPRAPLMSAIVDAILANCDCVVPDTLAKTQAIQCGRTNMLHGFIMGGGTDTSDTVWPQLQPEPNCPLFGFAARLGIVNGACCKDDACGKGAPESCSLECAVEAIPFYTLCRQTIDKLFDFTNSDRTEDGTADGFAKLADECRRMDLTLPSDRLRTLINVEQCDVDTSAISATVVQISAGSVHAPPPPPPGNGGHRRRRLENKRRQAQLVDMFKSNAHVGSCSFAELDARLVDVDHACCDPSDPSDSCTGETPPKACDFECSGVWLPLWADCQALLEVLFEDTPDSVQQFRDVTATCEALPIEPMFEAICGASNCASAGTCGEQQQSNGGGPTPIWDKPSDCWATGNRVCGGQDTATPSCTPDGRSSSNCCCWSQGGQGCILGCSDSPTPAPASRQSGFSVGDISGTVAQVSTDGAGTTYRLSLVLSGNAKNVYTIYGDESVALSMPPSYQEAAPFGANVGGTKPGRNR
jgi:hypothetical protein